MINGKWQKSYFSYAYVDTTKDGYTKQRSAFIVRGIDNKFFPVIKEERYGAPYNEMKLKKFSTFEEAWNFLKCVLKVM